VNAAEAWRRAHVQLLAKSIGELSYEQLLSPCEAGEGSFELRLASGVIYRFKAWRGVWDHLRVSPSAIVREFEGVTGPATDAGQFFVDAKDELGMDEIVLGNFLEEMQSTLVADAEILARSEGLGVRALADWDGLRLQSVLPGHPKILLNKGRLGWGARDLELYAPESGTSFELEWLAVTTGRHDGNLRAGGDPESAAAEMLSPEELVAFRARLRGAGHDPEAAVFLPVHPWQWERVVRIHFAGELANGRLVHLGKGGGNYRPQISLRTLSCEAYPKRDDVKLPLSILNTSAVRGIPARYATSAPAIASELARICREDEILRASEVEVLADRASLAYVNPTFSRVPGAPYRYHETLGALWRESVESKLAKGEKGILAGALFYQDFEGRSLVGEFVRRSGLGFEAWLARYFDAVVVPLYHLQLRQGIGLVAHGQNVVVRLRDDAPCGVFLKDFQGDLRLSSEASVPETLGRHLDRLPPHYLIHDLVTGHFLTVLRFVSETLRESDGFAERDFYRILSERIGVYLERTQVGPLDARLDLRGERVQRVLLNKVRFKIGYADSVERPLPMLGGELLNPLRAETTHV